MLRTMTILRVHTGPHVCGFEPRTRRRSSERPLLLSSYSFRTYRGDGNLGSLS